MPKTLVPMIQICSKKKSDHLGFTILEVLIVIGLIAMITVFALPRLDMVMKVNLPKSGREIASSIRSGYEEAILTGNIYRLGLDLDKQQYWIDSGKKDFLVLTEEQEKEEKQKDKHRSEDEKSKKQNGYFGLAGKINRKKRSLPPGIKFVDVYSARSKEPITNGIVYSHIFPHGFVEKLTIHLKDDFEREATLIVNSVSGKSVYYQRYIKDTN